MVNRSIIDVCILHFLQVVELVVVDEGVTFDASHPMHIHGHSIRVVAQEKLNASTSVEEVMARDKAGTKRRIETIIRIIQH